MHDVTDQPIVLERKLRGLADCSQQALPSGIPGAMAKGEKSRKVHGETRNFEFRRRLRKKIARPRQQLFILRLTIL